jgi:hypothetical protein
MRLGGIKCINLIVNKQIVNKQTMYLMRANSAQQYLAIWRSLEVQLRKGEQLTDEKWGNVRQVAGTIEGH